ncbi:DUF5629 family protein [Pseudomonas sp. S5(2021)]|uniref:DUF5629 family protein n=1 Tax=Stutzerimonas balearica TaxID=74829 RepID=UPI001CC39830|nr:DUF5629 family protein [Stutzerimonas balearica]MBZ5756138.1 DUF5629 family protein [Pseudomonas sp. S5(2021)]
MNDAVTRYLLDELELADMLEIDGLHAWSFSLNETLLDRAEAAAEAGEPFESDETVVEIECVDGRQKRRWAFSYNTVMEAQPQADGSWLLGPEPVHRLRCQAAYSAEGDA